MVGFRPWMLGLAALVGLALFGLFVAAQAGGGMTYLLGLIQFGACCVLALQLVGGVVDGTAASLRLPWPVSRVGNAVAMGVFALMALLSVVLAATSEAYWPGLGLTAAFVVGVFRGIGGFFDAPSSSPNA